MKRWRPQAAESAAADKTYGSLEQVPGTVAERQSVDEERFSSAALYGLAASPAGAAALLGERGAAVEGARGGGGGERCLLRACGRGRAGAARPGLARMSVAGTRVGDPARQRCFLHICPGL